MKSLIPVHLMIIRKMKRNSQKSELKLQTQFVTRKKYPQVYLRYEYTSCNISFEKLDLNCFIAEELENISSKNEEIEKSGRLNLLKRIVYLNLSYDFKTLKTFLSECLNEIEIVLKSWQDDFQQIKSTIVVKHTKTTVHEKIWLQKQER